MFKDENADSLMPTVETALPALNHILVLAEAAQSFPSRMHCGYIFKACDISLQVIQIKF